MFGSRFLDNGSTDSEKVYSFGNCDSMASFPLVLSIRHFCFLTPKIGLMWAYRSLRITQMADFYFFLKLLMLAASKFNTAQPPIVFTFLLEMTSPATSGPQQIAQTCSLGSCSGREFSITVQPILKKFTV